MELGAWCLVFSPRSLVFFRLLFRPGSAVRGRGGTGHSLRIAGRPGRSGRPTAAAAGGRNGHGSLPRRCVDALAATLGTTLIEFEGGKLIRLEFPRTEIQRFGEGAIIWSTYLVETETNGKRSLTSGRVTEVFVRRRESRTAIWPL